MQRKNILIISIAIILLVVSGAAGYFYWKGANMPTIQLPAGTLEKAGNAAENITESATKGVMPTIDLDSNPLEKKPDVNPVSKTNPFENIKTNPFE